MTSSRADRIKRLIPMEEFLLDYGYIRGVRHAPQQFRCDLHGDTKDHTPSARVYPEDNHAYCFACGKSRDVISWTMEKEGLNFIESCRFLERRFQLPEWVETRQEKKNREPEVQPDFTRVESLAKTLLDTGTLPVEKIAVFFEAVDCLRYQYERGREGREVQTALDAAREKIMHAAT